MDAPVKSQVNMPLEFYSLIVEYLHNKYSIDYILAKFNYLVRSFRFHPKSASSLRSGRTSSDHINTGK